MFAGVVHIRWAFAALLSAYLLHPVCFMAQSTEERVSALEQRLSRLERNLELVLERLSSGAPVDRAGLEQTKADVNSTTTPADTIKTQSSSQSEAATTSDSLQDSQLTATLAPTPASDAASEIQNVPYAGYMETHLTTMTV
jgi:hypothetical protein